MKMAIFSQRFVKDLVKASGGEKSVRVMEVKEASVELLVFGAGGGFPTTLPYIDFANIL